MVQDVLETSVGRVMFNAVLPERMAFYNVSMRSGELARVISDCYQELGRRATIQLLDDMNKNGFREATRSGLSFATDDLITPPTQQKKTFSKPTSYTRVESSRRAKGTTRCWTPGRTPANESRRR